VAVIWLQRLDGTQLASIRIAEGKARAAVEFRRPTKALEDVIAGGGAGLRYFTVHGANLMEGGVPIVIGGKIVGGIGVSGVDSKDDASIAQAGADAVR
jgi:uncharacterized protein GlcG (DUF336 family)